MPKQNHEKVSHAPAVENDIFVSAGTIKENTQITVKDTGWSEEQKAQMRTFGYDDLDMVKEWYS